MTINGPLIIQNISYEETNTFCKAHENLVARNEGKVVNEKTASMLALVDKLAVKVSHLKLLLLRP